MFHVEHYCKNTDILYSYVHICSVLFAYKKSRESDDPRGLRLKDNVQLIRFPGSGQAPGAAISRIPCEIHGVFCPT